VVITEGNTFHRFWTDCRRTNERLRTSAADLLEENQQLRGLLKAAIKTAEDNDRRRKR